MSAVIEVIHLTPRELEVLHWMAEGKTSDETAIILGCGAHTINTHKQTLMRKFEVYNGFALIATAFRRKIIE